MDKLTFFNGKKVFLVIGKLGSCVGVVVQNKGAVGMDG